MTPWPRRCALAALIATLCVSAPLEAQEARQGLEIELLQLTPKTANGSAAACEMLWRVLNRSDTRLSRVTYSVGIFTSEKVLFKSVPFNDIPAGRSKLVQFTMEQGCDSYESVLFSDLVLCEDDEGNAVEGVCEIELLSLSSPRTGVTFLQ